MLNSLANLFWGSTVSNEEDSTDKDTIEQQHGNGEHLETQQDEDWVVVKTANKENNLECAHRGCHHRHNYHHHTHHHNNHHNHNHAQQPNSCLLGEHEPVPQILSGASEVDVLDDAAALAQSMSMDNHDRPLTDGDSALAIYPLHDCAWVNNDSDKNSDTDSLPESVFSASSCRSHATYHPGGNRSEPWVVAPPPCFTGSQTGELSQVVSVSPLENLLIEHPSMSVYLSFPLFHPVISNPPSGENITISEQEETENRETSGQPLVNEENEPREQTVLQQRNIPNHAAIHPGLVTAEQLVKSIHLAQRMQYNKAQKLISKTKCERQNKVRECHSHGKGNARRNKRIHPSGVRSSRFTQRF